MEAELDQQPGKQLVIVRYWGNHYPFDEWVYNQADIDGSKVIWAREMGSAGNSELIRYYGIGRCGWRSRTRFRRELRRIRLRSQSHDQRKTDCGGDAGL